MSREDIGLPGYEPGNGYQPADFGLSARDFLKALPFVAVCIGIVLLRTYLGDRTALALLSGVSGALFLAGGIYLILNAKRRGETRKDARGLRIAGLALVVVGAAFACSCVLSIWGGYAVGRPWLDRADVTMFLLWLAVWTSPFLRQRRPDEEGWQDEAPISAGRRLAGTALLVLIIGILCVHTYFEHTGGFRSGRPELALPAVFILSGLFIMNMPPAEDASIDLRPLGMIGGVVVAIFFYFMFSN